MKLSGVLIALLLGSPGLYAQVGCIDKVYEELIENERPATALKESIFTAAPSGNYDLHYHRIHWYLSPDTLFISGEITSYFTLTEDAGNMYFDMNDSLQVDSVYFEGETAAFEHDGNALKILFSDVRPAGTTDSVSVYYHGRPAYNNFGSMSITLHDSVPVLWTLSEPYGASDWWPCKQSLTDKIDSLDIYITVPEGNKAGTAGLLVSEGIIDGLSTFHWKTNYPIATYLIGVSVTNFDTYSFYAPHLGDSVLFYNLVFPEDFDAAVVGINDIVESFELYTDKFGAYPFSAEKYGHMQFGWGGGMEHQTMSSVRQFTFDLLVHEMAHMWFGDKVTCASWEDIWLNEGFATYSNALCYYFIDDIHIYWPQWLAGTRAVITSEPNGSVKCSDTTDVYRIFDGRLTYYKGAWLLHMLHWTIGEEHFFNAIQNYISDPSLAYDFVTTDDFRGYLESESDTSLLEFFNDWYTGEGYPAYNLIWTQEETGLVTIALSQQPSHESVDFFEMNVPVRLKGDGDSLDVILHHTLQGQLYYSNPGFQVNEIILDPDMWLLHANDAIVRAELNENTAAVILYPNPASDHISIQDLSHQPQNYTVEIYSIAGQEMQHIIYDTGLQPLFIIDVSTYAPGIYIISVKGESDSLVEKIMVN